MAYPHERPQWQASNLYFYHYNLDVNTRAALQWEIAWARIMTLSTNKVTHVDKFSLWKYTHQQWVQNVEAELPILATRQLKISPNLVIIPRRG